MESSGTSNQDFEQSLKCSTHFVEIPADQLRSSLEASIGTSEQIVLENASTINR